MGKYKDYSGVSTEEVAKLAKVVDVVEEVKKEVKKRPKKEVEEPKTRKINCLNRLNVRSGPNLNAKVICVIKNNDDVVVEEIYTDWVKICTSAGVEGYVLKTFVQV